MLRVTGIAKTYGGVLAVKDLSFTAAPGQVVGLLGPNGSGKSTTINILTGLLTATRGHVTWKGADIRSNLIDYQARLGYVPEEPRMYGYMSAPEYLTLIGGLRDVPLPTFERRIARYLELFGLDTDRYAPLSSFSKGMRQKVLISAALLHDPDVVIFDEPCSDLDVSSTLILRSIVRTLADQGKVIVYSSHVLDMVEKICSDVLILHRGLVVAQDSVVRLRDLAHVASLEEVFSALAVDENVDAIGRQIASIGTCSHACEDRPGGPPVPTAGATVVQPPARGRAGVSRDRRRPVRNLGRRADVDVSVLLRDGRDQRVLLQASPPAAPGVSAGGDAGPAVLCHVGDDHRDAAGRADLGRGVSGSHRPTDPRRVAGAEPHRRGGTPVRDARHLARLHGCDQRAWRGGCTQPPAQCIRRSVRARPFCSPISLPRRWPASSRSARC